MKKTILTFLTIILLIELVYSQGEIFYRDKKLSTWGKINIDNVDMNNISFSIEEKYLAAAGQMGSLIVWDLENGNIKFVLSDTTLDKSYFKKGKFSKKMSNV